jgi:glycosyltransferase involved in cell wall biosynthesis
MSDNGTPLSILHTCWEGHPSGQTRVIIDLARGQAAGGHRVAVACPAGSPLEQMVQGAGITPAPLQFGRPAETGAVIARIATERRADLVNAHSSRDRKAVLWARGRARMAAAVVFTRHVRTLTFPLRLWWQSRQVDRIIAVSNDVARRLMERGAPGGKIVVVPNGLPPGFLDGALDETAVAVARARITRIAGAPVIGVVSRRKAQDVLLRAARHVARPLNIALIGIPPEVALDKLASAVPRHAVTFVPFVEDPRPYYACLTISVLPSLQEGLSIAQLESMAMGIPFIGSRYAGIPDLTTHDVDGLLVDHDDLRAWARAIERLLDEPGLAARLASAGRSKVLGSFTFDRTLARTETVYREAVAARRERLAP